MTPEELRAIMEYLRKRVGLGPLEAKDTPVITFHAPTEEEMLKAGLDVEGVKRILRVPWWGEMEEDIIETPFRSRKSGRPSLGRVADRRRGPQP
jgi:hypothetical protein